MSFRTLHEAAARQQGLLERSQAIALGISPQQIDRLVRSGRWRVAHAGAYVIGGAPPSRHQSLMAAVLAAGPDAMASHRAAAWLWGFDGFAAPPLELTVAN